MSTTIINPLPAASSTPLRFSGERDLAAAHAERHRTIAIALIQELIRNPDLPDAQHREVVRRTERHLANAAELRNAVAEFDRIRL